MQDRIAPFFPDKFYTGKVRSIGVVPDMGGRYEIQVSIVEHDNQLRAGLSGKVLFKDISTNSGVIIPRKCVSGSINDATVFLVQGDSVVSRHIEAISLNEVNALIIKGLSPKDKVVLSGQINLQDGTRVRILNQ